MSYWDKMDKKVWDSSEVMQELEKIFKKSVNLKMLDQALTQINPKIKETKTALQELNKASQGLSNPAKDGEKVDSENLIEDKKEESLASDIPKDLAKDDISDKEYKKARLFLLKELRELAEDASDKLDHKLAYKIERAIDSILFEDLED